MNDEALTPVMRPRELRIIEVDGLFSWSVGFTHDPRLPRHGQAKTFDKALAATRRAIKAARAADPIFAVDRRPAAV
jgi:hypothetical protein